MQLYLQIDALIAENELEAAIVLLGEVIDLQRWRTVPHYDRGLCRQKLGQFESAIVDYTHAIWMHRNGLGEEDADAFNNRGVAFQETKQFERAFSDYAEAIRLAPRDPKAFFNRGNLWSEMGNEEKALVDYSKSIELDAADPHVFYNRATSLFHLRRFEESLHDMNQSIQLDPNDVDAFVWRWRIYKKLGDKERAEADLREAKRLDNWVEEPAK